MTVIRYEVRRGAYYDSVVLMQLQKALADLSGVADAGVVMATPANRDLLAESDLLPGEVDAGSDDLLLVVRAADEAIAVEALEQVDELLIRRRSQSATGFRPRSLDSAFKIMPESRWVLISVPGRFAAGVAREALQAGRHVFLYSDNVSVDDERGLKELALESGLLLMGPDCGTAIVGGVGLGFANRVRRGNVGLVGASGTGLQAITSAIHRQGGGVSQALGTGGRDLSPEVGGITAAQGLAALARDEQTAVIVLVSKPPAPDVAARLLHMARATGKPVVVHFIGQPPPARRLGPLYFAVSLGDAATLAIQLISMPEALDGPVTAGAGYLRGLFAGGTLAVEALLGLQAMLRPLYSNVPLDPAQALADPLHSRAHTILDLGEDIFTQGRLHPMMDSDLRLRRLRQEADDPEVGFIMIDVVLGEGAHPDPAAELAPAIAAARERAANDGRELTVVAVVVGTDDDPQGVDEQMSRLIAAGAVVFSDLSDAVALAGASLAGAAPAPELPVDLDDLQAPLSVVNVGLESFHDSVVGQGASAVHVEWRPPAGGNEKMMALLARLKGAAADG